MLPWQARHDAIDGCAMLVNATNQGMIGQAALDLRLDKLPKSALVNDIIYNPRETPLIAAARARGHRTVTGLGMLLYQGISPLQMATKIQRGKSTDLNIQRSKYWLTDA